MLKATDVMPYVSLIVSLLTIATAFVKGGQWMHKVEERHAIETNDTEQLKSDTKELKTDVKEIKSDINAGKVESGRTALTLENHGKILDHIAQRLDQLQIQPPTANGHLSRSRNYDGHS